MIFQTKLPRIWSLAGMFVEFFVLPDWCVKSACWKEATGPNLRQWEAPFFFGCRVYGLIGLIVFVGFIGFLVYSV